MELFSVNPKICFNNYSFLWYIISGFKFTGYDLASNIDLKSDFSFFEVSIAWISAFQRIFCKWVNPLINNGAATNQSCLITQSKNDKSSKASCWVASSLYFFQGSAFEIYSLADCTKRYQSSTKAFVFAFFR